jgi:hypothetical protein
MVQQSANRDVTLMKAADTFISKFGDEEAAAALLELCQGAEAKKLLGKLKRRPKKGAGLGWGMLVGLLLLVALASGGLSYFLAFQSFLAQAQQLVVTDPIMATIVVDPATLSTGSGNSQIVNENNSDNAQADSFRLTQDAVFIQSTEAAVWMQATSDAARALNPIQATQNAAQTQLAVTATPLGE